MAPPACAPELLVLLLLLLLLLGAGLSGAVPGSVRCSSLTCQIYRLFLFLPLLLLLLPCIVQHLVTSF
jgi:hypothetical protein